MAEALRANTEGASHPLAFSPEVQLRAYPQFVISREPFDIASHSLRSGTSPPQNRGTSQDKFNEKSLEPIIHCEIQHSLDKLFVSAPSIRSTERKLQLEFGVCYE